jgi:hypothetical protein
VAEQLAHSGYDWLLVDCQHGPMNPIMVRRTAHIVYRPVAGLSYTLSYYHMEGYMVK